ncbi:ACP S-malonyltransferase [Nocardia sp. XZ_19_369]|uniref:ACP S-malonyltransferase n=1 Tax=Nocardia sp. XZ_19_369 TaxID=2769487 RepID=UPI00188E807B|nr:acyltransferase domain-containing protein [Nocardia sp. XZ_19_369]
MNGHNDTRPQSLVFLVPGQGGDPRGALNGLYHAGGETWAAIDEILDDIEEAAGAAGRDIRTVLLSDAPDQPLAPGVPQLATYAISVVLDRVLTSLGHRPDVIVGQSFGEIAALVCAGVFDISDGTRAVCALNAAFRGFEGKGAMVLVLAAEHETRELLDRIGRSDLVVACVNSPEQTIVSGPTEAIEALFAADGDRPRLVRLAVPYASHHPGLVAVADRFRASLSRVTQRPLRVSVHSPVGHRTYADTDDLREALVDCVTNSLDLVAALEHVGKQGAELFVELGVGDGLCRCVHATLPSANTLAPLAGDLSWSTIPRSEPLVFPRLR